MLVGAMRDKLEVYRDRVFRVFAKTVTCICVSFLKNEKKLRRFLATYAFFYLRIVCYIDKIAF